jgi:hypothetical protein
MVRAMRTWFLFAIAACTTQPPAHVATGEIDSWQTSAPLPVARANHCAVSIDDWVLVVGGNRAIGSGFSNTDEIDAAQLQSDGTLGPWQVAGHLASPANEPTCAVDGRTLYVIDGIYDNEADAGQIWTAKLDAEGHLDSLTSWGALPNGVVAIASGASVHDWTLILTHATLPSDSGGGDTTVTLRTPLAGAPQWSTDSWPLDFHAQYESAFTSSSAYLLGGYHDPAVGALADVYVAHVAADGTASQIATTTPLPTPVAFGAAVAVDDWLFVAGGRAQVFGAAGTTAVFAAPIAPDGSLGSWQPTAALPVGRTNDPLVLVGDYLVIAGGATSGPGDTTVLISRVRYAAP